MHVIPVAASTRNELGVARVGAATDAENDTDITADEPSARTIGVVLSVGSGARRRGGRAGQAAQ
jgi:hypothetical protein